MFDPTYEEKLLKCRSKKLFKFSKIGVIAGSYVNDGVIKSTASARIIRDGIVIYTGKIGSVQREKDSVKEVKRIGVWNNN